MSALKRNEDEDVSADSSVCSDHFLPTDFIINSSGKRILKDTAVPSVNLRPNLKRGFFQNKSQNLFTWPIVKFTLQPAPILPSTSQGQSEVAEDSSDESSTTSESSLTSSSSESIELQGSPKKTVTMEDFENICRTCLGQEKLSPITGTLVDDMKVEDLLQYSVTIKVDKNDFLPQNICENCLVELYKTYEFKKICKDNESTLKLLIQNVSVGQNEVKEEFSNITSIDENEYKCDATEKFDEVKHEPIIPDSYKCEDHDYISSFKEETSDHREEAQHGEFGKHQICNNALIGGEHKEKRYQCDMCPRSFTQNNNLKQHKRRHTGERPFLCGTCGKRFIRATTLHIHEKIHETVKFHPVKSSSNIIIKKGYSKCSDCDFTSSSKAERLEHRKKAQHGQFRKYKCKICDKAFNNAKMRQHMRSHSKERPYQCDMCPRNFVWKVNLEAHKRIHTGERPYVCSFCGRGFIQVGSLLTHEKLHRKYQNSECFAKKFDSCNICGRDFKRAALFHAHMEKHANPDQFDKSKEEQEARDYLCDICARTFKKKQLLDQHKLSHGEKSFLCSVCGRGFSTKASLSGHLIVHSDEKPHMCPVCKTSFKHLTTLHSHMLIHKGLKPYSCKYCSRSFTQRPHLTTHMKTHSGEKPYTCTYCNKSFALKGNLTVHVRIHTGERPYVCPICGTDFRDSSSMKRHRRKHSKVEQFEEAGPKEVTSTCEDEISIKREEF